MLRKKVGDNVLYSMHTKTFLQIFSKESLRNIEKTRFVVVSKRIMKSEEEDTVIFCPKLFPDEKILISYKAQDPEYFKDKYLEQLYQNRVYLAIIVKSVIEDQYPVILMCTPLEWKLGYMRILSGFIEEEFGFPVINYKKYKLGKLKVPKYDYDTCRRIIDRCNEAILEYNDEVRREKEKTREGRKEILRDMNHEEMVAKLKSMGLYSKDMNSSTMKEVLKTFYVGG